jgi:aminoglycoside phosphotransferase (APT) family kinase protein
MSCIGRPESDLALQCIGNELFAPPAGSGLPQPPSQAELLERYERAGGVPVQSLDYYRRLSAYMIGIAFMSLQRNLPEEVRTAQRPFVDRLWRVAEG